MASNNQGLQCLAVPYLLSQEILYEIIQYIPREIVSPLFLVSKAFKAAATQHLYRYVSFKSTSSFWKFCETVSAPWNDDALRAVRKIVFKVSKQPSSTPYAPFSQVDRNRIGSALQLLSPRLVGLVIGSENKEAVRDLINCIPDEDIPRLQEFEYTFEIYTDAITKIIRKNADHLERLRILDINNIETPAPLNLTSPLDLPKLRTLAVSPYTARLFRPGQALRDLALNVMCTYHTGTSELNYAFDTFRSWNNHPSQFIYVNRRNLIVWPNSYLRHIPQFSNITLLSLSMILYQGVLLKDVYADVGGILSEMRKLQQLRLVIEYYLGVPRYRRTQPTSADLDKELDRIEQWGKSCDTLCIYNDGETGWGRFKFEEQDIWLPYFYDLNRRPVVLSWMQQHSRYDGLFTLVDSFDPKFDPKSLEAECFSAFSETVQRLKE